MANETNTLGALCYSIKTGSSGKLAFSTKDDTYGALIYKARLCVSLLFNHTVTTTPWEITITFSPETAKLAEDVNIIAPAGSQYWGCVSYPSNAWFYNLNNVNVTAQVKAMPSTTAVETREHLLVSRSLRTPTNAGMPYAYIYYAVTSATLDQQPEDITYDSLDPLEKRIVDGELTTEELKEVTNGEFRESSETGDLTAYIYRDAPGDITTVTKINNDNTTWYEGDVDITTIREIKIVVPFTYIEPSIENVIHTDNNTDQADAIAQLGSVSLSTRVTDTLYMYKYTTPIQLNAVVSDYSSKWEQTRTPTLSSGWEDRSTENTTIKNSITELADTLRQLGASQFSLPNPAISQYNYYEDKTEKPKLVWSYKFVNGSPIDYNGNYYERTLGFQYAPGRYTTGIRVLNVVTTDDRRSITINNTTYSYDHIYPKHYISTFVLFSYPYTPAYSDCGTPQDDIKIEIADVCVTAE